MCLLPLICIVIRVSYHQSLPVDLFFFPAAQLCMAALHGSSTFVKQLPLSLPSLIEILLLPPCSPIKVE